MMGLIMIPGTKKSKKISKICTEPQSEITAKLSDPQLSDPQLSGAHLNSVSSSFNRKKEGRVTAVIAKAR